MFRQPQVYMVFGHNNINHWCYVVNIYMGLKEQGYKVYDSFCYSIGPLNLSDFKMN